MANRQTDGPEGPDPRREALTARRAERRRQVRRRRLVASGLLIAAFVAVVAVVAIANGGSSSSPGSEPSTSASAGKAGKRSGAGNAQGGSGMVRNSTPQPDWEAHTGPVPILEYHVLGEPEGEVPYPELYVSRPDFRHQLEWLDKHGYQAVTLEQVEEAWFEGGTLPQRSQSSSLSTTATDRSTPSPCRSCASTAGPASSISRRKAPTSTRATSRR